MEILEATPESPSTNGAPRLRSTQTQFVRNGNRYYVAPTTDLRPTLPVGVYSVGFNPMEGGYFLEVSDSFSRPSKVYGDAPKLVERFLYTYMNRKRNTGVLLQGEKGSGKSLAAKLTSIRGAEHGIPTLLVNMPFHGEGFNEFLSSISQQAIVIFDEFEKVYSHQHQKALLTLLDGTRPSNKLFIFTTNELSGVDYHMNNRPGRVFYSIVYKGLDETFMREYLEDALINKSEINGTIVACKIIGKVNFDMLQALVEEMNRYGETAREAIKNLNMQIDRGQRQVYSIVLRIGDETILPDALHPGSHTRGNPLADDNDDEITVHYEEDYDPNATPQQNRQVHSRAWTSVQFASPAMLKDISPDGVLTFFNEEENATLTFTPNKTKEYSMYSMIDAYYDR